MTPQSVKSHTSEGGGGRSNIAEEGSEGNEASDRIC